jgi:hypothetical protein
MQEIIRRLNNYDWEKAAENLTDTGYSLLKSAVTNEECDELACQYDNSAHYRKTISMQRYRFGQGEYKYFNYPLPDLIQSVRETVYEKIAPLANRWMQVLRINTKYPHRFSQFQALCHDHNQIKPTVLILKYGTGGYNTLHQDLYGEIYFPIQLVIFLSDPEKDYSGGEFVLTQQIPRAQSRAMVLRPAKGDILLFSTNFRPVKGSKGYYRVNMKHGVSELHSGERLTLGIIFHDGLC